MHRTFEPLYARLVFHYASSVAAAVGVQSNRVVKFSIEKKIVWASREKDLLIRNC